MDVGILGLGAMSRRTGPVLQAAPGLARQVVEQGLRGRQRDRVGCRCGQTAGAVTGDGDPWDRWAGLPTATISDCLDRMHAMHAGIRRVSGGDLVGPAFTIETCAGDSATIHRALEVAPAGSVLVIDGAGHMSRAVWGNVLTVAAQQRGVRGVVLDGVVRDVEALRLAGFPVFCRGTCPAGPHKGFAGRWSGPVQCGGLVVSPGDIVAADADGVVVVPPSRVHGLYEEVQATTAQEDVWMGMIRNGRTSADLLGLAGVPGRPVEKTQDGN